MTAEPIRSALGTVLREDTSLVLPSDKNQRTGQQRVLEQVKSIKRGKSKMVKSDSISSPTSKCAVYMHTCVRYNASETACNTSYNFTGEDCMLVWQF